MKHLLFLWLLLFCAVGASAQENAPAPQKIPVEYADIVLAGNLIKSSKPFNDLTNDSTLTQKRAALNEPEVRQALDLARGWLTRFAGPKADLAILDDGVFAGFAGARQIGRAFLVQQYVFMADGRISEAIDTTRDALVLSRALSSHSIIGWLVGVAITQFMIQRLVDNHLEQLSVRDCNRLALLADDWMKSPSLLPMALEREHQSMIVLLKKQLALSDTKQIEEVIAGMADESEKPRMLEQFARQGPDGVKQMLIRAEDRIDQAYRRIQLALATPYWEQQPAPAPEAKDEDMGAVIADALMPTFQNLVDRSVRQQVMARMLGCHAAIRRYRWEYGKVPGALKVLKLGRMGVDPFSGQEFVYKPEGGTRYSLESLGPLAKDDNGKTIPGQHVSLIQTNYSAK